MNTNMKIAIAGSSGLVGSTLTQIARNNALISEIYTLQRSAGDPKNEKIKNIVFNYEQRPYELPEIDVLICCLGTTIKKAGSKAAFSRVDYSYVVELAKTAKTNNIKQFVVISAMQANKESKIFYNQIKGLMEEQVLGLALNQVFILRPSLILGKRSEFRLGELLAKVFMCTFKWVIPKQFRAIEANTIAKAILKLISTQHQNKTRILSSDEIQQLAN